MIPIQLEYELLCGCGRWHKRIDFRCVEEKTMDCGAWIRVYEAPCGRRYVCHGEDPIWNIPALNLEDVLARKRAVFREGIRACPDCLAILAQNRERYWKVWRWVGDKEADPHFWVGPSVASGVPLCKVRGVNYPETMEDR